MPFSRYNENNLGERESTCILFGVIIILLIILGAVVYTSETKFYKQELLESKAELIVCSQMAVSTSECKQLQFKAKKEKVTEELKEKNNGN